MSRYTYLILTLFLIAILLFTIFIGCQTNNVKHTKTLVKLTHDEYATLQEVIKHIPIGSAVKDAKLLMEQNSFECSLTSDTEGTYLYCDIHKNESLMVARRWQVIIYYKGKNVTSVEVHTGLIGM